MTIERPFEDQFADLWAAVINLALPASSQLDILEAAGDRTAVDELALDLDDSFWTVSEGLSRNQLSHGEFNALNALNRYLDEISGPEKASLWTVEAVERSEQWVQARRLASEALKEHQIARVKRSVA